MHMYIENIQLLKYKRAGMRNPLELPPCAASIDLKTTELHMTSINQRGPLIAENNPLNYRTHRPHRTNVCNRQSHVFVR
jgi:hypothetical protein